MSPETVTMLSLISQGTGLISILALYVASIGVPWEKKSWKGETEYEIRRLKRQKLTAWIGVPCALIAVGCQTAITMCGP